MVDGKREDARSERTIALFRCTQMILTMESKETGR
jgi:hypothetical protein